MGTYLNPGNSGCQEILTQEILAVYPSISRGTTFDQTLINVVEYPES